MRLVVFLAALAVAAVVVPSGAAGEGTGSGGVLAPPTTLQVGFASRAITPVGEPPEEWDEYFTPHPETGVWGEPYLDLNGDGCLSGLTNDDLEPILDGEPPDGDPVEPHVDQPWNSAGDAHETGVWSVRGVTIVGDPDSTGKWDGVWANAGFGSTCTLGMHDDTWARAVVLDDGDTTVAMVSLDVVGWFNIEVQRARRELAVRYPDMPIDELVVSATHTHQGVDTMGYWGQLFLATDGKFPAYQAFIRSQMIDAIHEAWQALRPADLKVTTGGPPMPIRDSRPPVVTDPEVDALQFVDPHDDEVIGTVVGWSNHPEAQGSNNPLVSSDFPHATREVLEARYGAPAVYFSGAVGGLQTPLGVEIPGFGRDPSWERTYEIGRLVAESAITALDATEPIAVTGIEAARRRFYLDSDNNALRALNARGLFDLPTYVLGDSWGAGPEGHQEGIRTEEVGQQVLTEMVAVRLHGADDAGDTVFLTVPGELSPEIELGGYGRPDCPEADTGRPFEPVIRDVFDAEHVVVLGLGQDELGYIIPGYDFHLTSLPYDGEDGTGPIPVGAIEYESCGEGHYEETVSISSVFAPWVACVAAELAGHDPWVDHPACSRENTSIGLYGIDPTAGPLAGIPLHRDHHAHVHAHSHPHG